MPQPLRAYAVSYIRVQRGIIHAPTADEAFTRAMEEGEGAASDLAPATLHVSLENSLPESALDPDLHPKPLSLRDVAARLGMRYSSIRNYQARPTGTPFPPPDGQVATVNYWWPETIDAWDSTRRKRPR